MTGLAVPEFRRTWMLGQHAARITRAALGNPDAAPGTCAFRGCGRGSGTRSLCEGHRKQAKRWGLRRLRPLGGPFGRGLTGTRSGRRTG